MTYSKAVTKASLETLVHPNEEKYKILEKMAAANIATYGEVKSLTERARSIGISRQVCPFASI
ncbi:hypothetical protein [Paenibacillus alvei]|uniref:hypothetical protein n=1 Tax=Paenibacillus alvei TaxID=44250 RepID=UPI0013DA2E72|nr:hypothetical protein [Paenibacillus alvei]